MAGAALLRARTLKAMRRYGAPLPLKEGANERTDAHSRGEIRSEDDEACVETWLFENLDRLSIRLILRSIAKQCVSKDGPTSILRDARFAGSSG